MIESIILKNNGDETDSIIDEMAALPNPGMPFASDTMDLLEKLSQRLLKDAQVRDHPDLAALGFWLRRSQLTQMQQTFERSTPPTVVAAPRGLALHFPPANIDAMMGYSWALSALAGNRNIVRVSSRIGNSGQLLLKHISASLAEAPVNLSQCNRFVRWPRNDETTSKSMSAVADVRVIWGGDSTILNIRQVPVPAHSVEISFPDRASFCVLASEKLSVLGKDSLSRLAKGFLDDVLTFDQAACSSPHLLVFVGPKETCETSETMFTSALAEIIGDREVRSNDSQAIARNTYIHATATEGNIEHVEHIGYALSLVKERSLDDGYDRGHCLGGLVHTCQVERISDISSFVEDRHQTLTHFGFSRAELIEFVFVLRGVGLTRLVDVGKALDFSHLWDGRELMGEFCSKVNVLTKTGHMP
jgi:hypothetical protein